jgi:hypothetical protein
MVQVARATGYVIMPVGCPVCVLDEDAVADLPLELRDTALVVSSGADVLQAVTGPVEDRGSPQRGRGRRHRGR